ncbi:MAG: ion transporter [Rubripirellula sp.]|nr:ion transporter [Rubripirellula sp.]
MLIVPENLPNHKLAEKVIRFVDLIIKPLVVISIGMFLLELEMSLRHDWKSSLDAPRIFLWSERCIAVIFTAEFFARWWKHNPFSYRAPNNNYPFSTWGFIDFIAIVPFWAGMFAPVEYLGIVRSLRILRSLKFFRYSRELQLTALKFYRAYHNMKGLFFSIGFLWLFFAVICLELEQEQQPEKFGSLFDAAWFTIITGTTVGYGDAFPITFYGRIFVALMLIPIIGSIGVAISAFTNACDAVQALEDDPSIDPIKEWQRERERILERKRADRAYQMKD